MSSTKPRYAKLVYQLAPAALVSAVGVALLSGLAKPVPPPQATPTATAIDAEAVFTPTPRPAEAAQSAKPATSLASRPAEKPKPQPHKLTPTEFPTPRQAESTPALPLPITPPSPPQIEAAAQANSDPTMMDRVRGATAAVVSIPQRAYGKVTGWFAYDPPPRPPADVPSQDFKASM